MKRDLFAIIVLLAVGHSVRAGNETSLPKWEAKVNQQMDKCLPKFVSKNIAFDVDEYIAAFDAVYDGIKWVDLSFISIWNVCPRSTIHRDPDASIQFTDEFRAVKTKKANLTSCFVGTPDGPKLVSACRNGLKWVLETHHSEASTFIIFALVGFRNVRFNAHYEVVLATKICGVIVRNPRK